MHVDDDRALGIRRAVDLEVLGELLEAHIVAEQVLDHLGGRRAIQLGVGVDGDHVVLGEEVVVLLVARAEDVGLGADLVGLAHVVGTDLVGVDVLDAALIALELVQEHLVLVLGHEFGVAHEAVLHRGHGVLGAVGQLDGVGVHAV